MKRQKENPQVGQGHGFLRKETVDLSTEHLGTGRYKTCIAIDARHQWRARGPAAGALAAAARAAAPPRAAAARGLAHVRVDRRDGRHRFLLR